MDILKDIQELLIVSENLASSNFKNFDRLVETEITKLRMLIDDKKIAFQNLVANQADESLILENLSEQIRLINQMNRIHNDELHERIINGGIA